MNRSPNQGSDHNATTQTVVVLAQVPRSTTNSSPNSKSKLHCSFGLGNEIFICPLQQPEAISSCVQWTTLSLPSQRRVAFDTASKYDQYQASLSAATQNLQIHSKFIRSLSEILSGDPQCKHEKALWDLLSLFSQTNNQSLEPDLAKWLRSNASMTDILSPTLKTLQIPEEDPQNSYWPTLARVVSLGWMTDALELIGLHSAWLRWDGDNAEPDINAQIAVLEAVTLLLRRFPSISGRGATGGGTTREFDSFTECLNYRKAWQSQCKAVLSKNDELWAPCIRVGASQTAQGARRIVEILCGDDDDALLHSTCTWSELLVARLTHIHPEIATYAEVRHVLRRCIADRPPADEFQHILAAVLDACLDNDVQSVMRSCSEMTPHDWFMAHVPMLLSTHPAASGILSRELPHLGTTQVEFYVLEYVSALMAHPSTWPLAVTYLAWCPVYGCSALQSLILSLPYTARDVKLVLHAVNACKARGVHLDSMVHCIQGAVHWQHGYTAAAFVFFNKASDSERIDAMLSPLLDDGRGDAPKGTELLDALEECFESSPVTCCNTVLLTARSLLLQFAANPEEKGVENTMSRVVEILRQMPVRGRQRCLDALWNILPMVTDASKIEQKDVLQLIEWLELEHGCSGSAGRAVQVAAARLALVRLVAANHIMMKT